MRLAEFVYITLISSIPMCASLECHQCVSAWTQRECQQQDTQTCTDTQVCYNRVHRGGFAVVKYTKGCMDFSRCYDLQRLNDEDICRMEPSQCVYCCESNLCNAAVTSFPFPVPFTILCLCLTLF